MDEILTAFEAIECDYERHCAPPEILPEEYFKAEDRVVKTTERFGPWACPLEIPDRKCDGLGTAPRESRQSSVR